MDSINRKSGHSAISRITSLNTHFEPCSTMQKASVVINIGGEQYQEVIEHMPFKKVSQLLLCIVQTNNLFFSILDQARLPQEVRMGVH